MLNDGQKEPPKPEGAPEKYGEFKAPEGFELAPAVLEKATPLFKELGLNQEGAQKLIDFYAATSKEAAEAPFKLWKDTQDKWVSEIKADPEIGGKLDTVKATVSKALDSVLGAQAPAFREAMDLTGAGNNPAFIRGFYKMAQALTEGSHVSGSKPSPQGQGMQGARPSAAQALYPNNA